MMSVQAQSDDCDDIYRSAINRALSQGNCTEAQRYYDAYKECRHGRIDSDLEKRIQKCRADSTNAAAQAAADKTAADKAAAQAAADKAAAERAAAQAAADRAAAEKAAAQATAERAAAKNASSGSKNRSNSSFSKGYNNSAFFHVNLGLPIKTEEIENPVSWGVSMGVGERMGWYGSIGLGMTQPELNLHIALGPFLRISKGFMLTAGIGYCYDGAENPTLPRGLIYEAELVIGSDDSPLISFGIEGVSDLGSIQAYTFRIGFGWRIMK